MSASRLIERLHKVKRTGDGRWIAQCPAHDDKGPSLSIREKDDGLVLINCFAGCDTRSVLLSVGLDFPDVMPPKALGEFKPEKHVISYKEALQLSR